MHNSLGAVMKIVPVGSYVVLRRLESDEKSRGGIVLPDASRGASMFGRVLSIGDGRLLDDGRRIAPQVAEGDRVLLPEYAGLEVVIDGDQVLIVREEDILAVVE